MSGLLEFDDLLNKQIGYRVQPDGTTKYGRDYSADQNYWSADFCDMGLSWVAKYSGNAEQFGHFAYVPSHRNWFLSQGRYSNHLARYRPIFFDWNGNGEPNHIAWLLDYTTTSIHTIEFNHSNVVEKVTRPRNNLIMGTGIVNWPESPDTDGDFYIA